MEPVLSAGAGVERKEEKNIRVPMDKQEKRVCEDRHISR
jgi:hypothetical protein